MRSCTWIVVILLLAFPMISALAEDGEDQQRNGQQEPRAWTVPDCPQIVGTNTVTFTTDEGLTLAGTRQIKNTAYTYGLATLDVSNTLLASDATSTGASILRSEDAGCHWSQVARLPESEILLLTAGPGGTAYGWTRGRDTFYRIEGNDVVTLSAPRNLYGLAVDPTDAAHIRIGTHDCQLYESLDGGATFAPLGGPAGSGAIVFFTVEFDPTNFDHALCGAKGAYRTTDAGQNWSAIPPFDFEDIDLVYLFEFSPADPDRVWARANLDTMGTDTREILVSSDGGATFGPAIVQGDLAYDQNGVERVVMLSNQPTMAAHPAESGVLYFHWPTVTCCPPLHEGANLARYDADLDALRVVHIDDVDAIDAIAFNPAAADVMYLGLEREILRLEP